MAPFGLTHPDSVRSLINRAEAAMSNSPKIRKEVEQLRRTCRRIVKNQQPLKHEKRV